MAFTFGAPSQNRERIRSQVLNLFERLSKNEAAAAQKNQEGMIDRQVNSVLSSFSERLQTSEKSAKQSPEEVFGATQDALARLSTLGIKGKEAQQRVLESVSLYSKLFPPPKEFAPKSPESTFLRSEKEVINGVTKMVDLYGRKENGQEVIKERKYQDFTPSGSGSKKDEDLAEADLFSYQEEDVDGVKVQMPTTLRLEPPAKVREARKDKYTQELRQAEADLRDVEKTYAVSPFLTEEPDVKAAREGALSTAKKSLTARKKVAQAHLDVLRKAYGGKTPKAPDYLQRARGKGSAGFFQK